MMRTTARRLRVLGKHFLQSSVTPNLAVTPRTSLIDETVRISLSGLEPNQIVRLVAQVVENNVKFESQGVFRANSDGVVDLDSAASLAGSYTGVDPMGLFWSLAPCPGQGEGIRFVKKDVTAPISYHLKAIKETSQNQTSALYDVIAETTLEKVHMKEGVRRIPVNEGKLKGTVFIPEGPGPFPGLVDMFGGLVSLVETRAALLASHGFATFALAYLYQEDLPKKVYDVELDYIQRAVEWLSRQSHVDANKMGIVGLCFGGNLSLIVASMMPLVKAVVNINGISVMPTYETKVHKECSKGNPWPDPSKIYRTAEGFVINEVCDNDHLVPIPAWQNGAKVLYIVAEDDKQVHPKWHHFSVENCPPEFRQNVEMHSYPGAGHLIELPYSPHCRSVTSGRRRMETVHFIPHEYHDSPMMCGGNPKQHRHAQIDAWKRITEFLHRTLEN